MTKDALTLAACALACSCSATPAERSTPVPAPAPVPDSRPAAPVRRLDVELLYLDLTTCGRCVGTARNLEAALGQVASLLAPAGVEVSLRKVHVDTAELARRHRFVSSPTIRVDGQDVALALRESGCGDCAEIAGCGGGVDCRVWVWDGREHEEAPVPLLVDALLRAAYGPRAATAEERPWELPENLRRFYAATAARGEACCASPATCCAPAPAGGAAR